MKKSRIILGTAALVASFVSIVAFKAQNKSGGTIYTKSDSFCVIHPTCVGGGFGDGCALGTPYYKSVIDCNNNVQYLGPTEKVS